jgi:hypothetical protein
MCRTVARVDRARWSWSATVNANQRFVITAERIPGKSYRWYVNGKLYKQVLAPSLAPMPEEAGVTKVLASPYTVPQDYLRWPIQFESQGTVTPTT